MTMVTNAPQRRNEIKGPPLVQQLIRRIEASGSTCKNFCKENDFIVDMLGAWRRGELDAKLWQLELAWNILGYDLIAVKKGHVYLDTQREIDALMVEDAARIPGHGRDGKLMALAQKIRGEV